jgi:formiminotetrahydrofolate cyclodeaminase
MTGIEGVGWPPSPRVANRVRTRPGFFVPPNSAGTGQAAAAATTHATSLVSMIMLQEVGCETVADREARRHGQDMLAALAELQRALLAGGDDVAALQRLADLAASVPRATDPQLAALVSAILVRARVELARRQA